MRDRRLGRLTKQASRVVLSATWVLAAGVTGQAAAQPRYAPATEVTYGVDNPALAARFREANHRAELRREKRFAELAVELRRLASSETSASYLKRRYLFELAEVYGSFLLDLESSIDADSQVMATAAASPPERWDAPAASGVLLQDPEYVRRFVSISDAEIDRVSQRRIVRNRQLINGQKPTLRVSLSEPEIRSQLTSASTDLARARQGGPNAMVTRLMSRMVRADYELMLLGQAPQAGVELLASNLLKPEEVDLDEIDYLRLAEYLQAACLATRNIRFCEQALNTVYLPYTNLRDPTARWRYNSLINQYIGALTEANYQRRQFDEMLYYASLNKSRVVLEERLAFLGEGKAGGSVADAARADGIPRTPAGLPTKDWFKLQLRQAQPYLDLYLSGRLVAAIGTPDLERRAKDRSLAPLTTRDFGIEDASATVEEFADEALYVTVVRGGRVQSVQKVAGDELQALRVRLNGLYADLASGKATTHRAPEPFFETLSQSLGAPDGVLTVSPDKWLAKQPFDMLLGRRTTRAVNFFVSGPPTALPAIRVAGFFNPTLDLPGAEQEAAAVLRSVPAAQTFTREGATLAALQTAANANIVHLSMHGGFDETDARNSKLYFAGALGESRGSRTLRPRDPNALYARDMAKHPALSGRDLVFAAACQTGLSGTDQRNDAELQGILRPLTANGNRNVILSLWKVDDAATRDFVDAFYRRLSQGDGIESAFHGAQADVRRQRPQPYYWAAFYLSRSR